MNEQMPMRYNANQTALIKATFDDSTLMAIRKFMLQGKLNETESNLVSYLTKKPEAMKLLCEALIPNINPSAPLDGINDMFVIQDGLQIDYAFYDMQARQIAVNYFRDRINELEKKPLEFNFNLADLSYKTGKDKETAYIELTARNNYIIRHLEFQIKQLQYYYKLTEETEEQKQERLKKDSVE